MQQTLLSLLALLIATLLSFNQQQASIRSQQQTVRAEMEMMALGVASQTMQVIRARAFDKETAGPSDDFVPTTDFEPTSSIQSDTLNCKVFEDTNTAADKCNDIDDFHGDTATIPFEFPTGSFEFEVKMKVQYVDADLQPTGGSKSSQKQIILEVQDNSSSGDPRLPEPIEYSEVVSYP